MNISTQNIIKSSRDYLLIVFGLFLYAFGLTGFILPERVTTGGVGGLGALIYYATDIPVAYSFFIINFTLLVSAIRVVGLTFCIRTIFGVVTLSFMIGFLQPLFTAPIVQDEPFMNVLIGAILCGLGVGIVFVNNGSTGGTDIIAAVVNKYRDVSIGRTILYCDILIISSSYLIFQSIEKIVFGIVIMVVLSYMCDMVINASRRSVQFMIFSKHYEEIANRINSELSRGVTVLDGQGWYSKEPVKVVFVLAKRYESVNIFRLIKEIDPNAFISQANVTGVYGQGFDKIK